MRPGMMISVTRKVKDMLRYSKDEICAWGLNMLLERIHPEDLQRVQGSVSGLFSGEASFDVEYRFKRKDGEWIWVHNRAIATYREQGVILADGVFSDVSSRKSSELELQSKTALLEAQLNSTIEGILVVDPHGQIILQNQRFRDMFEIPSHLSKLGNDRYVLDYVTQILVNPSAFLAKVDDLYLHPMETSHDEIELVSGSILDRYSAPVLGGDGKHFGRIWTFRDITARKKNEDTLRKLSLAVEQSPTCVVIADPSGNISYVNRKFTELTGYEMEEVIGKNPRILNSGYAPREMYKTLWATITHGKVWHGEFRNKKKNGELYWESATITPILNGNGVLTSFLAMKEDITEHRMIQLQLQQAQKLEAIGQLAAGIAHEINTPIQFVADNLEFLRESWATISNLHEHYREALRNCADAIAPSVIDSLHALEQKCDLEFLSNEAPRAADQGLEGTRRVATIVRAMKEFSHPDSAETVQVNLNNAIESTITVARNEWKYVAELVTSFDPMLPPVVCHPGEVNQVILNLIVNAAHSIKEKLNPGEKGKITICTFARDDFAEIRITDTGMGIPDEIHTRIFEPFFTTKEVGKGTGQGLALAHNVVVKRHQGKIWFETEQGNGTTFFICLPLKPAI
jgi:PAS domain S-box-containing protein